MILRKISLFFKLQSTDYNLHRLLLFQKVSFRNFNYPIGIDGDLIF